MPFSKTTKFTKNDNFFLGWGYMPLQGYSLSINTNDNVYIEHLHALERYFRQNLHDVEKFIITVEHLDQVAQKKDHIQGFFTINRSTQTTASVMKQHMRYHIKNGIPFSPPATLLKKHKDDLQFGFGYCLKETVTSPPTGKVIATNLLPHEMSKYSDFYAEHNKKDTTKIKSYELFFDWLKNFILTCKARGADVHKFWEHANVKEYIQNFLAESDVILTTNDFHVINFNFKGIFLRYTRLEA